MRLNLPLLNSQIFLISFLKGRNLLLWTTIFTLHDDITYLGIRFYKILSFVPRIRLTVDRVRAKVRILSFLRDHISRGSPKTLVHILKSFGRFLSSYNLPKRITFPRAILTHLVIEEFFVNVCTYFYYHHTATDLYLMADIRTITAFLCYIFQRFAVRLDQGVSRLRDIVAPPPRNLGEHKLRKLHASAVSTLHLHEPNDLQALLDNLLLNTR